MKHRFVFLFLIFTKLLNAEVITPNISSLHWKLENGVKIFELIAEPVQREFAPGMKVNCWGYNGQTPGPTIEAMEGDRVRILVTNHLPAPTTVHWHGILLPNDMDGVGGVTQKPIQPGETFQYEFTLQQSGTCMYHSHYDETTQIGMGLVGFFIIHPKKAIEESVDRDFAIMLQEWYIPIGAATPNPLVMLDFNYFTFNGKVFPGTDPLIVEKGQKVKIRFGNLSMNNHPIHLHGYAFTITGTGAGPIPKTAQYRDVTVDVPVGSTRDIEFTANALGDWLLHCHKAHHMMNGMSHQLPNMMGVDQKPVLEKIQSIFPHYMPMGETGMTHFHEEKGPPNTLPPFVRLKFGNVTEGGMVTILQVKDKD